MSHSSEKRWAQARGTQGVANVVGDVANQLVDALANGEEAFQRMQEVFAFAGSTAQGLADQLFVDAWSIREPDPEGDPGVFETEANSLEVSMAQDAIDALVAVHEIYQAATNVAVTQKDRMTEMRRMI